MEGNHPLILFSENARMSLLRVQHVPGYNVLKAAAERPSEGSQFPT